MNSKTTNIANPSVYYFKTWQTGDNGGYEWAGTVYKGDMLIAHDHGETREEVEAKQDAYVAKHSKLKYA